MRRTLTLLACAGVMGVGMGAGTAFFTGEPLPLPAAAPAVASGALDTPEQTVIEVTRRVSPAVVSITGRAGGGSGVIIRGDGIILTNAHVVGTSRNVRVGLASGEVVTGEVLGRATDIDIAVVRIEGQDLPTAPLGNSDELQVGQGAIAIGNPAGFERTVTTGIISALNRVLQAGNAQPLDELIQTDAAINPGNSGGPLLDTSGRVVGINTAVLRDTYSGPTFVGLGFSVPINLARDVADQILTNGRVVRAFFGVSYADVDREMARQFGLPATEGIILTSIVEPAASAGLRPRDIITSLNGTPITNGGDFRRFLRETRPGTEVRVTGVRGRGDRFTATFRLAERDPNVPR